MGLISMLSPLGRLCEQAIGGGCGEEAGLSRHIRRKQFKKRTVINIEVSFSHRCCVLKYHVVFVSVCAAAVSFYSWFVTSIIIVPSWEGSHAPRAHSTVMIPRCISESHPQGALRVSCILFPRFLAQSLILRRDLVVSQ